MKKRSRKRAASSSDDNISGIANPGGAGQNKQQKTQGGSDAKADPERLMRLTSQLRVAVESRDFESVQNLMGDLRDAAQLPGRRGANLSTAQEEARRALEEAGEFIVDRDSRGPGNVGAPELSRGKVENAEQAKSVSSAIEHVATQILGEAGVQARRAFRASDNNDTRDAIRDFIRQVVYPRQPKDELHAVGIANDVAAVSFRERRSIASYFNITRDLDRRFRDQEKRIAAVVVLKGYLQPGLVKLVSNLIAERERERSAPRPTDSPDIIDEGSNGNSSSQIPDQMDVEDARAEGLDTGTDSPDNDEASIDGGTNNNKIEGDALLRQFATIQIAELGRELNALFRSEENYLRIVEEALEMVGEMTFSAVYLNNELVAPFAMEGGARMLRSRYGLPA